MAREGHVGAGGLGGAILESETTALFGPIEMMLGRAGVIINLILNVRF